MPQRYIGLHLRLKDDLHELITRAARLQLPTFQCFLVQPQTGKMLVVSDIEKEKFAALRKKNFPHAYAHISYYANLCDPQGLERFKKEVDLASRLGFTHVIVHPGSAKRHESLEKGIAALCAGINEIIATADIKIVFENSAHGKATIGGNIADFALIMKDIIYPEKISFCIDTAHAYVYGYNLGNKQGQQEFIELLQTTVGLDKIALIHLNDTTELLGSRIDRHHIVGQGLIGRNALREFILHEALRHIPVLMELPQLDEEQEIDLYHQIISWHTSDI